MWHTIGQTHLVCSDLPKVLTLAAAENTQQKTNDEERSSHWQCNDQNLEVYWIPQKKEKEKKENVIESVKTLSLGDTVSTHITFMARQYVIMVILIKYCSCFLVVKFGIWAREKTTDSSVI